LLNHHTDETTAAGNSYCRRDRRRRGNTDDFVHLVQLTTNTVKSAELFSLLADEVLYRLCHQEKVTPYEPQDVLFCRACSR
jgi:molecular chaperone Hsp33